MKTANISRKMNRIFYIYTEATGAVVCFFCAMLYLVMGLFVVPALSFLALPCSGGFAIVGLLCALYIIRNERKFNY